MLITLKYPTSDIKYLPTLQFIMFYYWTLVLFTTPEYNNINSENFMQLYKVEGYCLTVMFCSVGMPTIFWNADPRSNL